MYGSAVKIRLQSPPVDGAANDELVHFLADLLGTSRRSVEIVSGHASRRKRIRIKGLAGDAVRRALGLPS